MPATINTRALGVPVAHTEFIDVAPRPSDLPATRLPPHQAHDKGNEGLPDSHHKSFHSEYLSSPIESHASDAGESRPLLETALARNNASSASFGFSLPAAQMLSMTWNRCSRWSSVISTLIVLILSPQM